ncbi:hypothetical protein OKW42_001460 [Paraburkholderia sp. WC7.3d]
MASLGQKQVSRATIVCKLSSYILRFINDVDLRQSVQRALNRGEAYHRLRRAVAFVNGGKLRVHTEAEQQLWNKCARLIANAIIHYNTALLSRVHEQKRAAGDTSTCSGRWTSAPRPGQSTSTHSPRITLTPSTGLACCGRQPKRRTRKADSRLSDSHSAIHLAREALSVRL